MVVAEGSGRLGWAEWIAGGEELLLLRDAFPNVDEEVLAAGWHDF